MWKEHKSFTRFTDTDSSCKVCCKNTNGQCTPFEFDNGEYLYLRKGKPCTVGFCDGHVSTFIFLFFTFFNVFQGNKNAYVLALSVTLSLLGKMHETGTGCC